MPKFADDLDRAIMTLLEADGRLPNLEIARRLGVSEATVRKRIARLMEREGMRIVASLNGEARATEMLFLVHTEAGARMAVAERLATLPGVQQVALTTGVSDLVVRAVFRSDADALDFLVRQIEGAEGVRAVQASHVLKNLLPAAPPGLPTGAAIAPNAALDAFVREAARAPSLATVLGLACDVARSGLGADRVAVFLSEPDSEQLVHHASRGLSAEYLAEIARRVSPSVGIGVRVTSTRLHLYVEDARSSPLFVGMEDLVRQEGYRSVLFLPMLYGGDVIGLLGLYYDTRRRYSDDEIALAQALADQLAIAVVRLGARTASAPAEPAPPAFGQAPPQ